MVNGFKALMQGGLLHFSILVLWLLQCGTYELAEGLLTLVLGTAHPQPGKPLLSLCEVKLATFLVPLSFSSSADVCVLVYISFPCLCKIISTVSLLLHVHSHLPLPSLSNYWVAPLATAQVTSTQKYLFHMNMLEKAPPVTAYHYQM